ncbi:MAG: RNA 2',3'-cyclic phosphodiesterase [Nitrospirae bacterium]|nr:RNA 2',3'-cyclic phosphodiesterase [Nitrospirota bacterium]
MSGDLRSFIAIELPEKVKSAISELQQELKKRKADIRWVKPESIHLTLKFLGDTDEKILDRIVEAIKAACGGYGRFNLETKGVGVFPDMRAPRVLWLGISDNDSLTGLQKSIEDGLAKLGFSPEKRRFRPHLTIGRFKSSFGKEGLYDKIEELKDISLGLIEVQSIFLIKSELNPSGAKYTKIAGIDLKK